MDKEKTLADLIRKPTQTAKLLNLSPQTLRTWIELNKVPPKHVIHLANALDLEITDLLQYADKVYKPVKVTEKSEKDLDDLLAAYEGRPYTSNLPQKSITGVLARWGNKLPLMHATLKRLKAREITLQEAADTLKVTKTTIHNLRSRYGMAPGPLKAEKKPLGKYKQSAKAIHPIALSVIAGQLSAKKAAADNGIPLRTLHRHIAPLIEPLKLNELSHWSRNFRNALVDEIEKGSEKHSVAFRQWAGDRHLILKKKPKWREDLHDWRKATPEQLLLAVLTGDKTTQELAFARRGSEVIVKGLVDTARINMRLSVNPFKLSIHHQLAVAELILARMTYMRTGVDE